MQKYMPTPKHHIINYLEATEQTVPLLDGLDDALIGIGSQYTNPPTAIYSHTKIIETLIKQGMTPEEAIEYTDYNIIGAWIGEQTPTIIHDFH
jgi:hypothetical protein